jgi:hypothetical protein
VTAVYVYGVLAAGARIPTPEGVAGSKVRTVEHERVAALVSEVEGDSLAAPREVRAHWGVLQRASADATVLPVRFGTVLESDDAVRRQLLAPNAERLAARLDELEGRLQLSVKGDYDEEQMLRDVVSSTPAIAELRRRLQTLPGDAGYYESIRLGEAVAVEVDRRREEYTGLALDRLAPLATAARREELGGVDAAFNLSFLVERDSIDDFSRAVGALEKELEGRVGIRYVGPLPPYSFAEMDLQAGDPAWA